MGSSPLTRGKRRLVCISHPLRRIIPAYAGKTIAGIIDYCLDKDHPRLRGENELEEEAEHEALGSSPLTRGKPVQVLSIACQ